MKIAMFVALLERQTSIYFLVKPKPNHALRNIISDESLAKLCAVYKGVTVTVPPCHKWAKSMQYQHMHNLHRKQFSAKEIAKMLDVSLMTVSRELKTQPTQAIH